MECDKRVVVGTLNNHRNWSIVNFWKANGLYATATLRHLGALGVSYLAWCDSALGGAG
eukprot:COSAG02_NODE_1620_length_11617_cov_3.185275_11_plen_58_part_00